ncbi:MAG: hypothetical protein MR902_02525 [Campylobacter sp.]|nr:hypothetical protein [Campylobacter sp.]
MVKFICVVVFGIFLSGCATFSGYESDIKSYENQIYQKDCNFQNTAKLIQNDTIYNSLKEAMRARMCGKFRLSNSLFDKVENAYKFDVDLKGPFEASTQTLSTILLNDNSIDYDGKFYERVMVNLYKALNFMSLNDFASARVELNRALHRQNIARVHYAREIQNAKDTLKQKYLQNIDEVSTINSISEVKPNFTIYADFLNPFATYFAGLFFVISGEQKGLDLLKEASRMLPNNTQIQSDIAYFKHSRKQKQIWLIYENGMSAGLKESSITLPLFLIDNDMSFISFALPTLTLPKQSFNRVLLNGKEINFISSLDSVIATEYKNTLPLKLTKEVARAVIKASSSYALRQNNDSWSDLVAAAIDIFGFATARADIRYIPTFPSNFSVVSVPNLGVARIEFGGDRDTINLNLPQNKNIIIYIKSVNPNSLILDKIEF